MTTVVFITNTKHIVYIQTIHPWFLSPTYKLLLEVPAQHTLPSTEGSYIFGHAAPRIRWLLA